MGARKPLLAMAMVVLTACSSTTPSPEPSASALASVGAATTAPSASPDRTGSGSPEPSSPAPQLARDSVAKVITTDLVLRSAPGTGDDSQIYEDRLHDPTLLFVMDGPVAASGYDWYHVQPFGQADSFQIRWPAAGWVASSSREGEPWIAAQVISCPQSTSIEMDQLATMHPLESLACFGDRTIRVRGMDLICPGVVPDEPSVPNYAIVPEWLGLGQGCALHGAAGRVVYGAGTLFFSPGVLEEVSSGWIWLGGRFDHPAASSCVLRRQAGDPDMPAAPDLSDAQTVLLCRSHFAVTSAEGATAFPNE